MKTKIEGDNYVEARKRLLSALTLIGSNEGITGTPEELVEALDDALDDLDAAKKALRLEQDRHLLKQGR